MTAWIGFSILAAALLIGAFLAVSSKQLVSAVLWLGVVLFVTAVLFVTLAAPLLGGIQLLLYVGGVMTLMIFGVMLTGAGESISEERRPWAPVRAVLAALLMFATLAGAVLTTSAPVQVPSEPTSTAAIGELLLTTNLLAFELLSVLLLGTMVGAIVLSRRSDAGEPPRHSRSSAALLEDKP